MEDETNHSLTDEEENETDSFVPKERIKRMDSVIQRSQQQWANLSVTQTTPSNTAHAIALEMIGEIVATNAPNTIKEEEPLSSPPPPPTLPRTHSMDTLAYLAAGSLIEDGMHGRKIGYRLDYTSLRLNWLYRSSHYRNCYAFIAIIWCALTWFEEPSMEFPYLLTYHSPFTIHMAHFFETFFFLFFFCDIYIRWHISTKESRLKFISRQPWATIRMMMLCLMMLDFLQAIIMRRILQTLPSHNLPAILHWYIYWRLHNRYTRCLRPFTLVAKRRNLRIMLGSCISAMQGVYSILGLVFLMIGLWSIVGYIIFSDLTAPIVYSFNSLRESLYTMLVLHLSPSSLAPIMYPYYSISQWTALFFAFYVVGVNLFLAKIIIAFSYTAYRRNTELMYHKRLQKRKVALIAAFEIISTKPAEEEPQQLKQQFPTVQNILLRTLRAHRKQKIVQMQYADLGKTDTMQPTAVIPEELTFHNHENILLLQDWLLLCEVVCPKWTRTQATLLFSSIDKQNLQYVDSNGFFQLCSLLHTKFEVSMNQKVEVEEFEAINRILSTSLQEYYYYYENGLAFSPTAAPYMEPSGLKRRYIACNYYIAYLRALCYWLWISIVTLEFTNMIPAKEDPTTSERQASQQSQQTKLDCQSTYSLSTGSPLTPSSSLKSYDTFSPIMLNFVSTNLRLGRFIRYLQIRTKLRKLLSTSFLHGNRYPVTYMEVFMSVFILLSLWQTLYVTRFEVQQHSESFHIAYLCGFDLLLLFTIEIIVKSTAFHFHGFLQLPFAYIDLCLVCIDWSFYLASLLLPNVPLALYDFTSITRLLRVFKLFKFIPALYELTWTMVLTSPLITRLLLVFFSILYSFSVFGQILYGETLAYQMVPTNTTTLYTSTLRLYSNKSNEDWTKYHEEYEMDTFSHSLIAFFHILITGTMSVIDEAKRSTDYTYSTCFFFFFYRIVTSNILVPIFIGFLVESFSKYGKQTDKKLQKSKRLFLSKENQSIETDKQYVLHRKERLSDIENELYEDLQHASTKE